jgi:hypothetical protein
MFSLYDTDRRRNPSRLLRLKMMVIRNSVAKRAKLKKRTTAGNGKNLLHRIFYQLIIVLQEKCRY